VSIFVAVTLFSSKIFSLVSFLLSQAKDGWLDNDQDIYETNLSKRNMYVKRRHIM